VRWREVAKREFPELVHLIPDPKEIHIDKLKDDGECQG